MNLDKSIGCFVGLAVGDALGARIEGFPPETFTPITDMGSGGMFDVKPGEWTDDTSMALCLAKSLLEDGGFNQMGQMERYVLWMEQGYMSSRNRAFAMGGTVLKSIMTYRVTGRIMPPTDEQAAGNGGIMRLAPVPILLQRLPLTQIEYFSMLSSAVTHGSKITLDAATLLGYMLGRALQGGSKADIFDTGPALNHPRIKEIQDGSYKTKSPDRETSYKLGDVVYTKPEICGLGHVAHTLEAALWAFHKFDSFEEGMLACVNLGDDADSTGLSMAS